jgi:hypothetical protein
MIKLRLILSILIAANLWGQHIQHIVPVSIVQLACKEFLRDKWQVNYASQVVFWPKLKKSADNKLIKSSSLHLVSYFGLDWAINIMRAMLAPFKSIDK